MPATTAFTRPPDRLLESLQAYINRLARATLPRGRTEILNNACKQITRQLANGSTAKLTFICTHNSRRSHLAQVWAQAAAHHYLLPNVHSFSGGTETTACNTRTVNAMRRAGHSIAPLSHGDNPKYQVQYAHDAQALTCYSKRFNTPENPAANFIAMMCCADVSEQCPIVPGAVSSVLLHYHDPQVADDTPQEAERYDQCCLQIAEEMFYLMAQVKANINE